VETLYSSIKRLTDYSHNK